MLQAFLIWRNVEWKGSHCQHGTWWGFPLSWFQALTIAQGGHFNESDDYKLMFCFVLNDCCLLKNWNFPFGWDHLNYRLIWWIDLFLVSATGRHMHSYGDDYQPKTSKNTPEIEQTGFVDSLQCGRNGKLQGVCTGCQKGHSRIWTVLSDLGKNSRL